MEDRIFLGKYRVAPDELGSPAELRDHPLLLEAEDIVAEKKVSLELVPAGSLKTAEREHLETEAAAAKKLNHINIPALLDFGIEDDQLVYVTEYFDGTSAEEWVNSHGPMPTGAVLRIGLQVVSALGAAAFQKISHHALNPGNLILVPGQTPEGDWPLVKVLHFVDGAPKISGTDVAVAAFDRSSHYASPEQLKQGLVDFRSEIYSLGCTMWFLLTGAPPLMVAKGPVALHQTNMGLAVNKLHGMPKRVRRILAQVLSVNREARPSNALAFYRQIQDCLAQVERRETMARRFRVPLFSRRAALPNLTRRRWPRRALAPAAVLLAIGAVVAFVLPAYLHHERVIQAEEPIGVPIGVPDASASAAPVTAATAIAENQTQPPNPTVDSAKSEPVPTDSATVTAQNEMKPPAQPAPVAPNETKTAPPVVAEAPPASMAGNQDEPLPARAVSPEVRRAEPVPPSEGPEAPKVATKARSKKSETVAKSSRRSRPEAEINEAEREDEPDASMPPVPRGSMRAKFVGVTPEGQWIMMLPSGKIVVVPPRRSDR
jgi:serine/threonine protein kinase